MNWLLLLAETVWRKSRQLLPLLANRNLSLPGNGVYSTCVKSVMFHAAETWAMPVTTLYHLWCYGRAMVHLICNAKENGEASSSSQNLTSKIRMLYFALTE